MKSEVKVGLLGCGVVGGGTYQVLTNNQAQLQRVLGAPLIVAQVADLDWERERPVEVPGELRTTDSEGLVTNPEIDLVVETIGGLHPARELVLQAIQSGKSVVTSNKELMAKHGAEILDAASEQGVDVQFEGAAGGVIPIVRTLKESLAACRLDEVIGIVNGTTNYILTRMSQEGLDFEEVLAQAQALGYAEADPTDDVDGIDAANKLAILAAVAFGGRVEVESIYREGIRGISPVDLDYAEQMGKTVKLLAIGRRQGERLELRVHPTLLAAEHPLAAVNGVFNAIFLRGPECDEVMLYGRGAGDLPTGAAVAGDVLDCARNILAGGQGRVPCRCGGAAQVVPMEEVQSSFYLRTAVANRPGVLGAMASVFGQEGVSIGSVIQQDTEDEVAEIVWILHQTTEEHFQRALGQLREMPIVERICSLLRVVD